MKHCKTCDQTKMLDQFYRRKEGWYRSECRVCWAARTKLHRDAHTEWMDSLKDGPCTDCGDRHPPYIMQWDHLPQFEKTMGIGVMRARRLARATILDEISKCELVCANCHAIRTYERLSPEEQELVF